MNLHVRKKTLEPDIPQVQSWYIELVAIGGSISVGKSRIGSLWWSTKAAIVNWSAPQFVDTVGVVAKPMTGVSAVPLGANPRLVESSREPHQESSTVLSSAAMRRTMGFRVD